MYNGVASVAPPVTKTVVPQVGAAVCETGLMESDASISLVRSDELTSRVPYAYAAVAPAGASLLFTAGACPLNEDGETIAPGDFAAQADQTMHNLRLALQAAGAELRDVLKTTVYVATQHREDLATTWEVVRRHFGEHDAPSTLLGVAVLGYPDQLVEVEAVAAVRGSTEKRV